jgi:hypothetical protein
VNSGGVMGTPIGMEENRMGEVNGAYNFLVIIWIVTEKNMETKDIHKEMLPIWAATRLSNNI